MLDVRETRLPGLGKKFTITTARHESVCAVVHLDGLRELYHRHDVDDDPHVITLTDEEAKSLGAILMGAIYRPQLVEDLDIALKDMAIEWVHVPGSSPIVGLTVATCRIRSSTGASIVAILREEGAMAMPRPDEVLRADDTLVVIGRPEHFTDIARLVKEGPAVTA
jgi:TrkA domain protein